MSRRLQISVIGASKPDAEVDALAEEVGRLLAEAGATVVCGGRDGVMEAASRGAARAGGEVIAVLPDDDPGHASAHATHVVATGAGFTRNLAVVASGAAVIAVGGAWGTLSEIAYSRSVGRVVITLDSWSVSSRHQDPGDLGIEVADSPADAVEKALAVSGQTASPPSSARSDSLTSERELPGSAERDT